MKILFDHQIFSVQKYGGISRYFFELMKNFQISRALQFELSLKYSNNVYIKNQSFAGSKNYYDRIESRVSKWGINLINERHSIKKICDADYDIFHPTYYDPYFLKYLDNKPFVITAYDMIHEFFPENFRKNDRTTLNKKKVVENAQKIIAISENTKKDLLTVYDVRSDDIEVIHLASSLKVENKYEIMDLPEKYLLYVGIRSGYKNFDRFVKAIAPVLQKDKNLFLICAGGGNFSENEERFLNQLSIRSQVRLYSINDMVLATLYQKALCFVFPSLYEGFGIPVLEAFNCNCPVIVSNTSSFPEVAADAALYFDPTDIGSMNDSISSILQDPDLRNNLRERGNVRVKKYSWEKTANKTIQLYNEIFSL